MGRKDVYVVEKEVVDWDVEKGECDKVHKEEALDSVNPRHRQDGDASVTVASERIDGSRVIIEAAYKKGLINHATYLNILKELGVDETS